MIASDSNAFLAPPLLDHGVWTDWHNDRLVTPTDASTATYSGRVADTIALTIQNSGASCLYIINFKPNVNMRMVALLTQWIEEYGDDEDPDLDLQLDELRSNRLAFRERC